MRHCPVKAPSLRNISSNRHCKRNQKFIYIASNSNTISIALEDLRRSARPHGCQRRDVFGNLFKQFLILQACAKRNPNTGLSLASLSHAWVSVQETSAASLASGLASLCLSCKRKQIHRRTKHKYSTAIDRYMVSKRTASSYFAIWDFEAKLA